jgi:hypothetical protein
LASQGGVELGIVLFSCLVHLLEVWIEININPDCIATLHQMMYGGRKQVDGDNSIGC